MLHDCPILPFRVTTAYGGFAELAGLARADAHGLGLEFEVTAFAGLYRSAVRKLHISLGDLAAVELRRGWFSASVTVRVSALAALRDLPGSSGPEVTLCVRRRDRAAAHGLVSLLRLHLSELELQRVVRAIGEGPEAFDAESTSPPALLDLYRPRVNG